MYVACTYLTIQFNLSLCCNSTPLCLMKCSFDIAPISTRVCRSLISWMYVDRDWAVLPGVRTFSALDCWDLEGGEWDGLVSFLPWGLKKCSPWSRVLTAMVPCVYGFVPWMLVLCISMFWLQFIHQFIFGQFLFLVGFSSFFICLRVRDLCTCC